MDRNRYADLLRVAAIGAVVYGHWILTDVTYSHGKLSGLDALDYIHWGRWVTLVMQVMPVFFLLGGYVNAQSWMAHHARGERWTQWVRDRSMRLLWPTTVFVIVAVLAVTAALLVGVPAAELAEGGWAVAFQLWFLPVYLVLILLPPVLVAAHRRWGLAVPAAMAPAGLVRRRRPDPGRAACLGAVPGGHDRRRRRDRDQHGPPSVALLTFAAAQVGLVLAAEPVVSRWLAKPRRWRRVQRLNAPIMNVYLWHMAPALTIAVAFYPTGIMPQPATGTGEWWLTRLAWFGLLTALLVALVAVLDCAERPMLQLPTGIGAPGWPARC